MENIKLNEEKKRINFCLFLNILAFILAIMGPMLFLVGVPPFVMSVLGMVSARQASVFHKKGNVEQMHVATEMSSNYAKFSLWWMLGVYILAGIAIIVILFCLPDTDIEIMRIISPTQAQVFRFF